MKFWITRLNANPLTSLVYNPTQDNGQSNPNPHGQNEAEQFRLINELKVYDQLKGVINHSRILSLSIYERDLIYYSNGYQYYYRAKNNLLYILAKDSKQSLPLSITNIDNIILNVIKLYQQKCIMLNCSCKLPRKLTPYQSSQFANLTSQIQKIIYQEQQQQFQLNRVSSLTQQTVPSLFQQNINKKINERSQEINRISGSVKIVAGNPKIFQKITQKNITVYNIKQCFLIILVSFLLLSSLVLYNYYISREQIFI